MKRPRRERRWNKKSYKRRRPTSESVQIPEPRPEGEVFADLTVLCAKPGYIHALAFIVYHDSIITGKETFTKEDFLRIYSPKRLIRTEISVLIGLMLKSGIFLEIPHPTIMQSMIDDTHRLMDELHQSILAPARAEFVASWAAMQSGNDYANPLRSGTALREAMFYGAESAFTSQYIDFSRTRYAADDDWLIKNRGFTIAQAAEIAAAIIKQLSEEMMPRLKAMIHNHPSTWTMLDLFCFAADDIVAATGLPAEVVNRFLDAYSCTAPANNAEFVDATANNIARVFPFIKLSNDRYTSFLEYNTSEALYDNAFYWMITDKGYAGNAANNRGAFTEHLCIEFLERVMPKNTLYRNVTFKATKGKAGTEADAIIFYGRRVFVFQAKSKRLTATAKTGDDLAISRDFKTAIQSAYDQAIACIDAIRAGVPAYDALGNAIQLPDITDVNEYFPICITSEHYPALSFQVSQFLELHNGDYKYPLVFDIFTLDIITEFLNTTLFFTDYVAKRSNISDKITSSHEMVILSYHLKKNL